MYYTLKYTERSNELHPYDATSSPSSKKREGKMAKLACANCRSSKAKCSAELDGCRRCLQKELECRYEFPHKSGSSSMDISRPEASSHFESISSGNAIRSTATKVDHEVKHIDLMGYLACDPVMNGGLDTLGDYSTLLPDSEGSDLFSTVAPGRQQLSPLSPYDGGLIQSSALQETGIMSTADAALQDDDAFDFGDLYVQQGSTNLEPRDSAPSAVKGVDYCPCFRSLFKANEAIESAAWLQTRLPTKLDGTLQHQKQALRECEKLFQCRTCVIRSDIVMLVLSISGKILKMLEGLLRDLRDRASPLKMPGPEQGGVQEPSQMASPTSSRDDQRRLSQGYSVSAWDTELDGDDRSIMLQSLLVSRLRRLEEMSGLLMKLINEQDWPIHRAMVRDLRKRLSRCLVSED